MKNITSKFKIFLVITLALLVVGLALTTVFGFNNSVDYKDSYEISVGVKHDIAGSVEKAKKATSDYFAEKGVQPKEVYTQVLNDGTSFIYKFDEKTGIVEAELKEAIELALNDETVTIIASVDQVKGMPSESYLPLLWIFLIAIAFALIYLFIFEKKAGSLAVLSSSVISAVLSIALLGLARIPVLPFLPLFIVLTFAIALVVSLFLVRRFNELSSLYSGSPFSEIADKGVANSFASLVIFAVISLVFSGAFMVHCGYLLFVGLMLVVSIISALFVSISFTPVVWAKLKQSKK